MSTEEIKNDTPSTDETKEELVKNENKEAVEETDESLVGKNKEEAPVEAPEEGEEDVENKKNAYYYAIGRRKSSIAQIRLYKKGNGEININEKEMKEYFPREEWQAIVSAPLKAMGQTNKLNATVKVQGGGVKSQSEAIRLGIARALLKLNPIFKRGLKKYGYLTRDSRVKERKKYGLKGARRAPQWVKR